MDAITWEKYEEIEENILDGAMEDFWGAGTVEEVMPDSGETKIYVYIVAGWSSADLGIDDLSRLAKVLKECMEYFNASDMDIHSVGSDGYKFSLVWDVKD
jgi:hypothetical protein